MTNPKIWAFDNKGITFDRYTIVIAPEGRLDQASVYGLSCNADAPNGFNQYCGTLWECPAVWDAIRTGEPDQYTGEEVALTDLPQATQRGIAQRLKGALL